MVFIGLTNAHGPSPQPTADDYNRKKPVANLINILRL